MPPDFNGSRSPVVPLQVAPPAEDGHTYKFNRYLGVDTGMGENFQLWKLTWFFAYKRRFMTMMMVTRKGVPVEMLARIKTFSVDFFLMKRTYGAIFLYKQTEIQLPHHHLCPIYGGGVPQIWVSYGCLTAAMPICFTFFRTQTPRNQMGPLFCKLGHWSICSGYDPI